MYLEVDFSQLHIQIHLEVDFSQSHLELHLEVASHDHIKYLKIVQIFKKRSQSSSTAAMLWYEVCQSTDHPGTS